MTRTYVRTTTETPLGQSLRSVSEKASPRHAPNRSLLPSASLRACSPLLSAPVYSERPAQRDRAQRVLLPSSEVPEFDLVFVQIERRHLYCIHPRVTATCSLLLAFGVCRRRGWACVSGGVRRIREIDSIPRKSRVSTTLRQVSQSVSGYIHTYVRTRYTRVYHPIPPLTLLLTLRGPGSGSDVRSWEPPTGRELGLGRVRRRLWWT